MIFIDLKRKPHFKSKAVLIFTQKGSYAKKCKNMLTVTYRACGRYQTEWTHDLRISSSMRRFTMHWI